MRWAPTCCACGWPRPTTATRCRCRDEILKRSGDAYRRIRNTARFLLGNLHGFDPARHLVPLEDMVAARPLDRAIARMRVQAADRRGLRALRFRRDRAGPVELLQRRSRLAVPGRHQGPPVHDGGGFARPAFGAERDVPHRRGVRALDRADPELHRRRDVALSAGDAGAGRARTTCCSPPGTTAWRHCRTMPR